MEAKTSSVEVGSFIKGWVSDPNDLFYPESSWSKARNLVNNDDDGNLGVVSNEPANLLCVRFPFPPIGTIHIYKEYWAVFLTNNTNSEIGLFNEETCEYVRIVRDTCLNFNTKHLVIGRAKENFDCSFSLYWADGNNPDRVLNIGDIRNAPFQQPWPGVPYKCEQSELSPGCFECVNLEPLQLDCDKIRLNKTINTPIIKVSKGSSIGQLLNGSYFVAIAYTENGQRVTDYIAISNIQSLFTHQNSQGSLNIEINNLDTDNYLEYELVVVASINQNVIAKRYGIFNTTQSSFFIDFIPESLVTVDIRNLPISTPVYVKSEGIYQVNNYLLRTSPTGSFQFNYQPLANQIKAKWVLVEQPVNYYRDGGNEVGYMRDEQYPYFIRWIYDTGDKSASFHIPGRAKEVGREIDQFGNDLLVGGNDNINSTSPSPVWKVQNTADIFNTVPVGNNDPVIPGNVIAEGSMGYWESEELYPSDKPEIYNSSSHTWSDIGDPNLDLCGKPIRHHKMPEDVIALNGSLTRVRVNSSNEPKAIRILGVKFENIKPPVDNDGNLIPGIVGYEILRGSRHGNKSIICKGIINNTRRYVPNQEQNPSEIRFVNYPYNRGPSSLPDPTLSNAALPTGLNRPLYNNVQFTDMNVFSFHSFDTNFEKPFLSVNELKNYGEVGGENVVRGEFQEVPEHPKHKLITDFGLYLAWAASIGFAANQVKGKLLTKRITPKPLDIGLTIATPPATSLGLNQASANTVGQAGDPSNAVTNNLATYLGDIFSGGATDAAAQLAQSGAYISTIAPLLATPAKGNIGGGFEYTRESGELDNTPFPIRQLVAGIMITYYHFQGADTWKNLVLNMSKFEQYAHRAISVGKLYRHYGGNGVFNGNRRRSILDARYIRNTFTRFAGNRVNNLYRPATVLIETDGALLSTSVADNVPVTITETNGGCSNTNLFKRDKTKPWEANTSSYYVGLKGELSRQYGQIDNIIQILTNSVHIVNDNNPIDTLNITFNSDVIFGGDVYIGKYSEKNTFFYFSDWLFQQPDGTEFDYSVRFLVGSPTFWINTFDFSGPEIVENLSNIGVGLFQNNNANYFGFASAYHHLDRCQVSDWISDIISGPTQGIGNPLQLIMNNVRLVVRNAAFYLYNSSVREFFLESEYNIDYRDWGERDEERHYDEEEFGDLKKLFAPKIIESGNSLKYDLSNGVSKLVTNFTPFGQIYPRYYNPYIAENCYQRFPYRIIYSLPQNREAVKDHWRVFLVNNRKDFSSIPTSVHKFGKTGAIILFEAESPIIFPGVEELQTDAQTIITLGDGTLFNKAEQNLTISDLKYQYGSCNARLSAINTPAGIYFMSPNLGKIFQLQSGQLSEISGINNRFWFNRYLPFQLLQQFPDYPYIDNPVHGIGCQSIYDSTDMTLYFCKKDYRVLPEYEGEVVYNASLDLFVHLPSRDRFSLGDPKYFENCSWTVSFDPASQIWISHHDWHPDLNISGKQRFLTTKNNSAWKHNVRNDLYCNFYGVNYPFEIEQLFVTGQNVNTLRSIEYMLEAYVYNSRGDKNHLLDSNFDQLIVYNSEQISGLLNLFPQSKENPFEDLTYPVINTNSINVLYSKEEQKYRVNQFWDITRDRGEFTNNQVIMWTTDFNGYTREINPNYVNYNKADLERKKFRHYSNRIFLSKLISNNVQYKLKLKNSKLLYSAR